MIVIGMLMFVLVFVFYQALLLDMHKQSNYVSMGNATLENLISDSILENWLSDRPTSTAWKAEPPTDEGPSENTLSERSGVALPTNETIGSKLPGPTPSEVQSDDSSVASPPSKDNFINSLFEPPTEEVAGDWSLILGTFDHYDDENWKEFLIKTEVPLIVQMFLSDSSETVTISRTFSEKKDTKQGKKSLSPKMAATSASSDFEVTIETSSWLLTHVSKFRLGKTYIEHDLDGTDSKNTFFLSSPRLLIHNKIKDKWRTAIVRHFDEKGLNMTFVDRDRHVTARRFFKRIA